MPARSATADKIILGIDPGITATGYAIIQAQRIICLGTIRPQRGDSCRRLEEICRALEQIIKRFRPSSAALEKAFYHKNASSLARMSEIRGALLLTLLQTNLAIAEYSPTCVKLTTTGNGRASKAQVRYFVERLYHPRSRRLSHHAIDALAIAYTAHRKINRDNALPSSGRRRENRFALRIGG